MPSRTVMAADKRSPRRFRFRFRSMLAVPALVIMASCGTDDGLGKRYPVSGKVTYNGNALEKGSISFVSENLKESIGATGSIVDGAYTLSTGGNDDGARAGKYKVTITSTEDFLSKAETDFEKDSGRGKSSKLPPQYSAKAAAATKSLIPAGYGDPRTTTLTAEVKEQSNTIDFPLSDKDAPPDPPKGAVKGKGQGRGR